MKSKRRRHAETRVELHKLRKQRTQRKSGNGRKVNGVFLTPEQKEKREEQRRIAREQQEQAKVKKKAKKKTPPPPNLAKRAARERAEANAVVLIVENSRTHCPDCGKYVQVNVKNKSLHSHQIRDSVEVCPVKTRFKLQIESLDPRKGKIQPPPPPKVKKPRRPRVLPAAGIAPDGPEKSTSVRALSGGAPGLGKNRKH